VRIPRPLLAEVVAHAREDAPNECCGLIGGRDGVASSVHRAGNEFASPMRFQIESGDQLRILNRIEADGESLTALYHSHPRSEAYPSQTDVNLAEWWPGVIWLICSLAGPEPVVRAFEIADGEAAELELIVDD
jgi:proteasome lid subunit RPN8/RPN11